MDIKDRLPEAGASATARVVSARGFHWLFTVRDSSAAGLLSRLTAVEALVLDEGWSPESGFFKEEPVGGRKGGAASGSAVIAETTCAACGAPATRKGGVRKDNSRWEGIFCTTGEESHKVWLK